MAKNAAWQSLWRSISQRPVESYNKAWLGAIALAVIGALVGAMLLVKAVGLGYSHYTGEFLQAASLQPGANVSYAGVPVGNVTSVELAGDRIEVGMRVRDDITLRKDARASIKITTILGNQYVELRNGGDGTLPNRRIDLAHTEVPYDLQDATSTFEQVDEHPDTVLGDIASSRPDRHVVVQHGTGGGHPAPAAGGHRQVDRPGPRSAR
ncbi:Putative Mce family protein [Mycobacteroides abscessus subsp. abscessus]|nr:Putative Mce family protein [Mycobacteroides abscessus subsp. abscessus]